MNFLFVLLNNYKYNNMKNLISIFLIICIVISCKSKEEKANILIKEELRKTLFDFSSYDPIETKIDSAFTSIYSDSIILNNAYFIEACSNKVNEYVEKSDEYVRIMKIYSDGYNRSKFNEAKIEALNNLEIAKEFSKKMNERAILTKSEISKFSPSFCGWKATHKFRCKTKGGNFAIANYEYIIDADMKNIISYEDLDDDNYKKIIKLIDELKYQNAIKVEE